MKRAAQGPADRIHLRIHARGVVQGVGFRPWVYHQARKHNLGGWVQNGSAGLIIDIEGASDRIRDFTDALRDEAPAHSHIHVQENTVLEPEGSTTFSIRESGEAASDSTGILPDLATCPDCLAELNDKQDRRYRYPFINCTHCGPRYSIIKQVPYDRKNTSMAAFPLCPACRNEYVDPLDRRFHAQPVACPDCGPRLSLCDNDGQVLATRASALGQAVSTIKQGGILAVKGLGGFHLMVDACQPEAVQTLRQRKQRAEKPFALMMRNLDEIRSYCSVSPAEQLALTSVAAPIVLLDRHTDNKLAEDVASASCCLGIMLPYTPLHHLILEGVGGPVVATSGNLSDEPLCFENENALSRLGNIADAFLMHDRPIVRPIDDSIVRIIDGREMVIRRARGYAPMPLWIQQELPPAMAVGAHLKNTVAVAQGNQVILSPHIGDLETVEASRAFDRTTADLQQLFKVSPVWIACDLHPDYSSTHFAHAACESPRAVQHHLAHMLSCMVENDLKDEALGVVWDGTGYGLDGSIWGGETFIAGFDQAERVARLRPFSLPGGDQAVREPRRSAWAVLYELYGSRFPIEPAGTFPAMEQETLMCMLQQDINCPRTGSMGRLFDAVASLAGVCQFSTYEGQAAMQLEYAATRSLTTSAYPYILTDSGVLDWGPLIDAIVQDLQKNKGPECIAARFHNTLVCALVAMANQFEKEQVVLSGGCFQNRRLIEEAIHGLREEGFKPYWHQRVPPNDGGIALGQLIGAFHETRLVDQTRAEKSCA